MKQTNIHTNPIEIHTYLYLIIAIHTHIVSIPFLFLFFFFLLFFFSSHLFFYMFLLSQNDIPTWSYPNLVLIFLLLHFGPQVPFYLHHNFPLFQLWHIILLSYDFISCFDKFHFYPCILYKFQVSQISRFAFKLRKSQMIPTKHHKHAENDYDIFRGVTNKERKKYFRIEFGRSVSYINTLNLLI